MNSNFKYIYDNELEYTEFSSFILLEKTDNGRNILAGFAYKQSEWIDTPILWFFGKDHQDNVITKFLKHKGVPILETKDVQELVRDINLGYKIEPSHYKTVAEIIVDKHKSISDFTFKKANELKDIAKDCDFYIINKNENIITCYKKDENGNFTSALLCFSYYVYDIINMLRENKKKEIKTDLFEIIEPNYYNPYKEGMIIPTNILNSIETYINQHKNI